MDTIEAILQNTAELEVVVGVIVSILIRYVPGFGKLTGKMKATLIAVLLLVIVTVFETAVCLRDGGGSACYVTENTQMLLAIGYSTMIAIGANQTWYQVIEKWGSDLFGDKKN